MLVLFCVLLCFHIIMFVFFFFFFNDTATTEIYTLSLHDALPILKSIDQGEGYTGIPPDSKTEIIINLLPVLLHKRSEEHTSELQSQFHLVCRLLLEKKKLIETRTSSRNIFIMHDFPIL